MKPFKTTVEIVAYFIVGVIVYGGLMLLFLKVFYWSLYLSAPLAAVPAILLAKRARLMCRSAS